jgi:hypothetical protein
MISRAGTRFDRDEMKQVVEFIVHGGLARSRGREKDRLEEERLHDSAGWGTAWLTTEQQKSHRENTKTQTSFDSVLRFSRLCVLAVAFVSLSGPV